MFLNSYSLAQIVVNPTSMMGASKLLERRLSQLLISQVCIVVPRQSLLDKVWKCAWLKWLCGSDFSNQVRSGHPITVTDPRMTRFVMTKAEAAELVVTACT